MSYIGTYDIRFSDMSGEDLIKTSDLRGSLVPTPDADFTNVLEPFCLTYDGYAGGERSIDDCMAIAEDIERKGPSGATIDELRTAAFIWQRKVRWNDQGPPDPQDIARIRRLIAEIRRRVPD